MAAKQFFLPYQAATINAVAEPGAQLAFYTTGTLNKLPVYATSALTTQLSNPVVANSAGRFPDIYLDDSLTYRMKVLDRNGAQLDDFDPFTPGGLLFDIATNAVTPQLYAAAAGLGTLGLGIQDDSAAFVLAIAALKAEALNPSGAIYGGSRSLFIPAGHYYLGTTALDINHTLIIQGEGSGQFGPGGGGCTRLRWADATDGIRFQAYRTSGDVIVDGADHAASGGGAIADICLEGGYAGTEGDHHGLVIRNAIKADNLYIKNWPGEGVKAWAGNVTGNGNVSGNVSTTRLIGVKTEGCRGGFDFRGSDSNICTTINCEGYQNRQWGIRDESGGNTHQGCHAASNGLAIDGQTPTQCTRGGRHYAVIFGQETGASTNAPKSATVTITIASPGVVSWTAHGLTAGTSISFSTTGALPTGLSQSTNYYVVSPTTDAFSVAATIGGSAINTSGSQSGTHTAGAGADNTWWYDIEAGAVSVEQPAWVTGMTWRTGGDYLTLYSAATLFLNCYSEAGGFSQLTSGTILAHGTILKQYLRGGWFWSPGSEGLTLKMGAAGNFYLETALGQDEVGYYARDNAATNFGYVDFVKTGGCYINGNDGVHFRAAGVTYANVTPAGLDATAVAIGGGTALSKSAVYTPSITPASVAAATVAEQTFTVTGLTTADKVIVNPPAISNSTGIAGARVSAADTLAIRFTNPTAGALTPTSGTYTVLALRS